MFKTVRRVANGLQWRVERLVDTVLVRQASKLLSGKSRIDLADDECCAVTLLKNGEFFVPELLRHHRSIGVRHFLVIDNGSTDGTAALLAGEPDVTVVQNRLPVARYETMLRGLIPRRHVRGGWFLIVDSDELFDPPPGCNGQIGPLLRYLRAEGHTAMLAHALDMFSDLPASETALWSYAEAIDKARFYSLGHLEQIDYRAPDFDLAYFLRDNETDGPQHFWSGGLRMEVFGENPVLTRHNIIRNLPGIPVPQHVHAAQNVRVSDITASFRHYKFTGDYVARERRQVQARTWLHGEDVARVARYDSVDAFAIRPERQQGYEGTETLLRQGFIKSSEKFQAFLAKEKAGLVFP
ncbi:MAG TPA: glycosyltransferase family 2 protein [Tabrizicola sp.]|nr:glycosyltransferase family 2 protein [Tabrizicola sp.]